MSFGKLIPQLAASFALSFVGLCFSQDSTEADNKVLPLPAQLAELTGKYQAAMTKAEEPIRKLQDSYRNRVQSLADEAQKNGNLENLLLFKKEIENLGSNGPGQASEQSDLAKVQAIYHEHAARLTRDMAPVRLKIETVYVNALKKQMADFTKTGDLDSGLVVQKALEVAEARAATWAEESAKLGIAGPKIGFDWEALTESWQPGKFETTSAVGGSTTLRSRDRDVPEEPALLIGFEIWLHPFRDSDETVRGVVPLFRTQSGKTFDGLPRAAGAEKGKRRRVVAKHGYVVGGLKATSENAIRSMTVIFHKLSDKGTDPKDFYESDTYGEWEGGYTAVVTTDGKVPVGVDGYYGLGLDQLALIVTEL
jgi:hypothetical protein